MDINFTSYKILESMDAKKIIYNLNEKKCIVVDLINSGNTLENGIKVVEAVTGGIGKVKIEDNMLFMDVEHDVALSMLGCQLAGWKINIENDGKKVAAFGSGPARIIAKKPKEIFDMLNLTHDEGNKYGSLALETKILPTEETCKNIIEKYNIENLILACFNENSKVGLINIIGRIVEVGVFRLNFLNFDVNKIKRAKGNVYIPKNSEDGNDAIIYGGTVEMWVEEWNENLNNKIISAGSKLYGKTYKEMAKAVNYDFHKIDPDIFAPAKVIIHEESNGKMHILGEINKEILSNIV